MQKVARPQVEDLLEEAAELGREQVTFPLVIFNLARRLADQPDKEDTYARAAPYLSSHPNAFVRRVFFTMIRFMETPSLAPRLASVCLQGLRDPSPWVQYDAAWMAADYRIANAEIVAALGALAGGYKGGEDIDPGDAQANLRRRAAETLRALAH